MIVHRLLPLCLALAACGDDPALDISVEAAGPYPPGTRALTLTDAARARTLPTQVWYPAVAEAAPAVAAGFPVVEYETGANRTRLTELLAAADPTCPTATAHAARDAAPAAGSFPLIAMSHCHECTRFSTATVAERLASHGFVVIAVDHVGNTLWDQPSGLPIDTTTLALRVGDVRFALDAALNGVVPAELHAIVDPTRVGVVGHSFGAVTAGKVAQDDPRIGAAWRWRRRCRTRLCPA
jgi:predicted dienelactone hydrolase